MAIELIPANPRTGRQSQTSRPSGALLYDMDLPLRGTFYPSDLLVEIVTNHPDVLEAASDSLVQAITLRRRDFGGPHRDKRGRRSRVSARADEARIQSSLFHGLQTLTTKPCWILRPVHAYLANTWL